MKIKYDKPGRPKNLEPGKAQSFFAPDSYIEKADLIARRKKVSRSRIYREALIYYINECGENYE